MKHMQISDRDIAKLERKASQAAAMLKSISNTWRLLILCQLARGEKSVGAILEVVDLSQSALSQHLAAQVGPMGRLEVVDVAQIQVDNVTRKLKGQPQAHAHCADLADPDSGSAPDSLDGVCCFFLLHEVPSAVRTQIVDNLLRLVRVGGKVVFTDYHQTKWWHPLRPIMAFVFWRLEPFAASLQRQDISKLSERATQFSWKKSTRFGGLYQQLVAVRQT